MAEEKKISQCPICGGYSESGKTFACKKCRKPSLCITHRDRDFKGMCLLCGAQKRTVVLQGLEGSLGSIRGFLGFLQFLFIVSVILWASTKYFIELVPPVLLESPIIRHINVWGGLSALGAMVFCLLYLAQKSKVTKLQEKIEKASTLLKRGV